MQDGSRTVRTMARDLARPLGAVPDGGGRVRWRRPPRPRRIARCANTTSNIHARVVLRFRSHHRPFRPHPYAPPDPFPTPYALLPPQPSRLRRSGLRRRWRVGWAEHEQDDARQWHARYALIARLMVARDAHSLTPHTANSHSQRDLIRRRAALRRFDRHTSLPTHRIQPHHLPLTHRRTRRLRDPFALPAVGTGGRGG